MTKQKWVTVKCVAIDTAKVCEKLTDDGYWIYGVWPTIQDDAEQFFQILACKAKEDSVE